jgi:hypothetical protein
MSKRRAAGKKARPQAMPFFNLRLNEEDLSHLRWLLEGDCQMNREFMQEPIKGKKSLEDWVIARDMLCYSARVIAMIDKVCPQIAKRAAK